MTIEEIKQKKRERGYTNEQMAALSGLPLATVQKVLGGTTKSPRYRTVAALSAVFENAGAEQSAEEYPERSERPGWRKTGSLYTEASKSPYERAADQLSGKTWEGQVLREPGTAYAVYGQEASVREDVREISTIAMQMADRRKYPRQGTYTVEDYLSLPDTQRVELIDGVFFDMSAPSVPHQIISGEVYSRLREFVRTKGGLCMVLVAPTDVQLDCDMRTMVQPDILIVCDRDKITRKRVFGAPDFVMEILSSSTKLKDYILKLAKYRYAGVREYWMVDAKNTQVLKYTFQLPTEEQPEGDIAIEMYPFEKPVPVSIFGGECTISFAEIAEEYAFIE